MKTANLLKDVVFNDDKPVIQLLFETGFTKDIRIALKSGQSMKEHQTSFPILIEVVQGLIDFGVKGQVITLSQGDLISLEGSVPHSIAAKENTIIRLTLSKVDDVKRVYQVIK